MLEDGVAVGHARDVVRHRACTPGVRPVDNRPTDDQKRVASVTQAFEWGADYIVVGRPIRDAADPRAAAEQIQREIAAVLERG